MKPNWEHAQRERVLFSNNFKRILESRGKTQADVVADLNITSSTVSDWANAKKYPRVDKMQTLADYLGVLISDLREEKPATVSDDELSSDEQQLIDLFRLLPEEERDTVAGMIEGALRRKGLLR